jgi:ABC-type sulfate transport system permease subunit
MPLLVKRLYDGFDKQGAYSAAVLLAAIALVTVLLMSFLKPGREKT